MRHGRERCTKARHLGVVEHGAHLVDKPDAGPANGGDGIAVLA